MRFGQNENPYVITNHPTGSTVTIDIYNLTTNAKVVDGAAMSEVATTGNFKYLFNPSSISALTEFLYISSDGANTRQGTKTLGGIVDLYALEATSQAIKTEADKVQLIPVNPLLTNDARIDAIKAQTDLLSFTGSNINAVAQIVSDKAGYSLTTADKDALAVTIEAALLNEGDGQQLIDAIVTNISNNLDLSGTELAAIGSAVRTELAVELARIDADISSAGGGLDEAGLHTALNSYTNKNDFKATSISISTPDKQDIAERVLNSQVN